MKRLDKVFIFVFVMILGVFMMVTLSNNDEVSQVERRNLQTFPKFTLKSIFSKNYYDDLTEAFKDQLAFRSSLIKGYFLFNFQRYNGDAVKGMNGQLYSASENYHGDTYYNDLANVTKMINEESKNINAQFIFLSIPRKDAYMTSDLPKNYNSSLEIYKKQVNTVRENLNSNIIFIDALSVFNESGIYNCYYSNDHHITPKCAYSLLNEINKYTGITSYNLTDIFEIKKTIVNGAYNRQLGQTVKSKPEDLYVVPKINLDYVRYENGKLSKKKVFGNGNSYEDAYMEGDMAYTVIDTDSTNDVSIMYVGSSYTNILEAFSVPSYKRVVGIDYRHNKTGKSIASYVDSNDIDYVVFVPAQSTSSFSINQIKVHLGK